MQAQNSAVTGVVMDGDTDTPLPGATVLEKGTSNGTITDLDGKYTLNVAEDATLVFTFIGFKTQEVTVGGKSSIDVTLNLDVSELNEVVVIGYGTQQKKVATGSISKVSPKNLDGYKVPDVTSALSGQISGVVINQSSGQPGSNPNIFIRGVGTNGDNSPLYIVDGLQVQTIKNINPSDIESLEVLKDAASSAIYGTRAANGVIIITTKKGAEGKGTVTYEGFVSESKPWRVPSMLNAQQYVQLTREKFANAGQSSFLDQRNFPKVGDALPTNTNWMDQIFNTAHQINHRVTAQMNNTYMSLEYWDQNGVVGGSKSDYKRYAFRINSTKDINDYVTMGENLYINRTQNQSIATNNAFGTVIADAFSYDPITPVYDSKAQYGFAQSPWVQKEYINPLSRLYTQNNHGHTDEIQGNINMSIKPIEGLTLKSDLGINYNWNSSRTFTPDYQYTPAFYNYNNNVSQGYYYYQSLQWENYANYKKQFGSHSLDIVIGNTQIMRSSEWGGGSTMNIPEAVMFNPNFQYLDAGQDTSDLSYGSASVKYKLASYYGRIMYDYKDKYLFTATLRRDGSSRFGANNRYGYFPSFSAGWVLSDESFFPKNSTISFMKLRSSWGMNGSDRIGDLGYTTILKSVWRYPLGMNTALNRGTAPPTVANPNLKWEQSVQFDVGLEANLFKDKISTEFDYYIKTTKNLLGQKQVPGYFGVVDFPTSNLGEFQNKGFEAAITYRDRVGEFNFHANLNYTTFKNTVISVPGSSQYIPGWTWPVRNQPITRMTEGLPVGSFFGYKTQGIFQSQAEVYSHVSSTGDVLQPKAKPGDLIFADVNGDGKIDSKDITNLGSPWPKHIFGLSFGGDWKGFDFNMLFSAQLGQKVFRAYERSDVSYTNYQTIWLDRWTESNPSNKYPRLVINDPNGNQRPSDFYVENASYLRLKNIQVGYNLPQKWAEKIKMSGIRIYLSGNNVLTLTKYNGFDPSIGTNGWVLDTGIDKGYYPTNKTFGGGIKITM